MIVDRHWMVADDELHIGVFSRDDLAYSADPDRAVHHLDTLHLIHKFVLRERRILSLQPIQTFWRTNFLNVEIFEEGLEMLMPFPHVSAGKCSNGL